MCKDIIGMEASVSDEYGDRPPAGDVSVDEFIECSKFISFAYGLDDSIGINLIQEIIQRDKVHLVITFFRTPAGVIIAFGVLGISGKGKA